MEPDLVAAVEAIRPYSWRRDAVRELALHLTRTVANIAQRNTLPVHATASTFIIGGARVLLLWHPKFERWLQPGGHCDGETDLRTVAAREAREETGLDLALADMPFDVDLHPGEPAGGPHIHLDVRFVARVEPDLEVFSPEGLELGWFEPGEISDQELAEAAGAALHGVTKWPGCISQSPNRRDDGPPRGSR